MKLSLLFIVIFFGAGCSGQLVVNPIGCKTSSRWGDSSLAKKRQSFKIEKRYWLGLESKEVKIKGFLKEQKIKCSDVQFISVKTQTDWTDALYSLIPFISRKKVVVKGQLKDKVAVKEGS